jgi:hypothetical protein
MSGRAAIIPYYQHTNPVFAAPVRHTVDEVVTE